MKRTNYGMLVRLLAACTLLTFSVAAQAEESNKDKAKTDTPSTPSFKVVPPVDNGAAKETKPDTACNLTSCDSCCEKGCSWVGGVEAVFLSAHQRGGPNDFRVLDFPSRAVVDRFSSDSEGLTGSPRIWLGVQGPCWGLVGRYWRMNSTGDATGMPTLTDDPLSVGESVFKAETADLEITRPFCVGATDLTFSMGFRYAELCQGNAFSAANVVGDAEYRGVGISRYKFAGPGMTMALTGTRPIGCRNFNLFFSGRASVVWDDDAVSAAEARASYITDSYYADSIHSAIGSAAGNMFIGEIQVGGQWNYALKCLPAEAFLRVAFEYQHWDANNTGDATAYSYAGAGSGVFPTSGTFAVTRANSGPASVDLLGFNVGTGFMW